VLDEPYHLSYPFLIEHDGEIYMMPEKAAQGRVDLYGCVAFPDQWEHARTLIEGQALSDCALFSHEGRWWMLCTARQGRMRALGGDSITFSSQSAAVSRAWV
jgi:hypothetical protein